MDRNVTAVQTRPRQKTPAPVISAEVIEEICERLQHNQPVRRRFAGLGRLHIDRQLPFLCVHRRPREQNDQGTERLVMAEASYLVVFGKRAVSAALAPLLRRVIETLSKRFGAFLLVEVWSMGHLPEGEATQSGGAHHPVFEIHIAKGQDLRDTAETLRVQLDKIKIHRKPAEVEVKQNRRWGPPGLPTIFSDHEMRGLHCQGIGLEVAPIYRSPDGETVYPLILRSLRRTLSPALRRTFHQFAQGHTSHTPPSYQALGRRRVVKAVWEVDEQLAGISNSFDFLLQVTPVNIESAWLRFKRKRFQEAPAFQYRPRPIDPVLMKRRLYQVPIERVEDPTLGQLFWEKQMELDRQLTMLADRDTQRFLYGSLQLYGNLDGELVSTARDLLDRLPSRTREDWREGYLDAAAFAERAREELSYYHRMSSQFTATVQVREDMYAGLMVSRGQLLIGRNTRIPSRRVEALLSHEVGTHLLTYYNGRAQPFRQLYVGLAGYDELQEGLAVLAEHLVGGLSRARLRLLAARVMAAHSIVEGASFIEVFRLLDRTYEFDQKTAFTITMRIFRGGGLIKDAVYLRGLVRILNYVKNRGELESLYVGKIAAHHIPLIKELQWREVLRPLPLRPRFLDQQDSLLRLNELRNGYSLIDMARSRARREKRG
jgi:uncharacterized protein (TIGR02421 family)